jgi:hypothetical protein
MGGFLGIGGSSAKTDRGNQLAATQGDWSLFNYGLPTAQAGQATGTSTLAGASAALAPAEQYYQGILQGGRTGPAQAASPAINTQLKATDATTKQLGEFGTGRSGGAVASQQQAKTAGQSNIDNIINQTLGTGAAGLTNTAQVATGIGGTELSNATQMLGISSNAVNDILSNATNSRSISNSMNLQTQEQWGQLIGSFLNM